MTSNPVTTILSSFFALQTKSSAGFNTHVSLKPGPTVSLPLTVLDIATPVPQGQAKLPTLASPAYETILQEVPAQPNAPLLVETAQKSLVN